MPVQPLAGDVRVELPNATSGAQLSNGWPFDSIHCRPPSTYCTAKVNSQGCTPEIDFTARPARRSRARS
jgi:hypothetical protein